MRHSMKRNIRRISVFFLLSVLLFSLTGTAAAKSKKKKNTPTPSPAVSSFPRDAWSNTDDVYLLDDMSPEAEKLLPIPYGEKVLIVEQDQDEQGLTWCLIEYEEEIGFVSRDQLSDAEVSRVLQTPSPSPVPPSPSLDPDRITVTEEGEYTDKDHVAEYIRQFRRLPGNYITKLQAQKLGWIASRGNLWKVAPGKSIGGDRFGNYEGQLPYKRGRTWYECDIDFDGKYRNEKRILYSSDGLIYYTEDHYNTFEDITERK